MKGLSLFENPALGIAKRANSPFADVASMNHALTGLGMEGVIFPWIEGSTVGAHG